MLRFDEPIDSGSDGVPEEPWPSMADIDDAEERQHDATAVHLCREYLKREPECGLVWLKLGGLLHQIARYDESRAALEMAIQHASYYSETPGLEKFVRAVSLYEMGNLYRAWGKYEEAAAWYRCGIELQPDRANGYTSLGEVLAQAGDLEAAEAPLRKATQCKRGFIDEAYLNLGLVLRSQGRFTEAAECLRKALELDPDGDAAGGTRAALEDVERIIRLIPG
jgi:tetratricopeptide (TPR) repeat protein